MPKGKWAETPSATAVSSIAQPIPKQVPCPRNAEGSVTPTACLDCEFFVREDANTITCQLPSTTERTVHPRNALNALQGNEWTYFTKSVLRTSYPSRHGHELRRLHGANKPPQLMQHIIEFFTKPGERVLDPFAGVGGTLLGASLSGRRALGIEINPEWIRIYLQVCQLESLPEQPMIEGDCLEIMEQLQGAGESFDLVATDPPYSVALKRTMCTGRYEIPHRKTHFTGDFSASERDLRNTQGFAAYYRRMGKVARGLLPLLKPGGYMALIIRDSYQEGKYVMASYELSRIIRRTGFVMKGIKVWYQTGAPVRPYGYPYAYVPNIVHQNILIFQKPS